MMYRDHREYDSPPQNRNHEILRSWLRGEADTEILRTWLTSLTAQSQ